MKNDEFVYILGNLITEYRNSYTPIMSSREFATRCNLGKTTINALEKHTYNSNISIASIGCIANGMGIEREELMNIIQSKRNIIIPPKRYNHRKDEQEIITNLKNNSSLFELFNLVKDWDKENIEKLHSIALDFKK